MTAANDLDVEKAFSDQASGFVENKVGDLMKDEYRIGFEIVKKNDSNTRMVGIFAFKVDKDLIFAPVFFINGEIKGPLLYRVESKMFVPADREWASYLIESMERRDGKSRSKTSLNESAPLVQMQRLTFNPSTGMGKRASGDVVEENNVEFEVKPVVKPVDGVRGVYVVQKSLDTKPGEQPKLSTGCSVLKMASADDCTLRMYLDGVEVGYVTKEAAESILEGKEVDLVTEGHAFRMPASGSDMLKKAFFDNIPDNSAQWDAMIDAVAHLGTSNGSLAEFLREPGFGKVAAETIVKAASDYVFADALAGLYPEPAKLFPESFTEIEKSASNEGTLDIHYATDELEKSASVSKKYFADGFYIKDTRPEETLSVVYEESPGNLSVPSDPGVYSILGQGGEFVDNVFVAPVSDTHIGDARAKLRDSAVICCAADWDRDAPKAVAIKDGKIFPVTVNVYGVQTGGTKDSGILKDSISRHNVYYVYLADKLLGPIAVHDINTADGVIRATVTEDYYNCSRSMYVCDSPHRSKTIIINKDLETSNVAEGVFGKDAKFIKVEGKFDTNDNWETGGTYTFDQIDGLGSKTTLNNWIFSKFNVSKVKVEKAVMAEKKAYTFSDDYKKCTMNRVEALVKLARDMGINSSTAYNILDTVDNKGSHEFFLQPTEKVASRLTLVDRPIFDDEFDSEFGLPMQPTKKYRLRVQGDQEMAPASAIGDMMNPTTATGLPNLTVATTAPEDLRQLADTYHLPNVFEHGMIGTLADTFNATAMVDKYIPKLEEGVDALGRTKFLLHWCPDDFERAYGRDDMASLEAEIDANFEELGALLLKLIRKSEKSKRSEIKFEEQ